MMVLDVISKGTATEAFVSGFGLILFMALAFAMFAFVLVWLARQLRGAAK